MTKQQEKEMKEAFLQAQTAEMESATIYKYLARKAKNEELRDTLLKMASNRGKHAGMFKKHTRQFIEPKKNPQIRFRMVAGILGMKFSLKSMQMNEQKLKEVFQQYAKAKGAGSEFKEIVADANKHLDWLQKFIEQKTK